MAYEFDGTTQYMSLPVGDIPFTAYPITMAAYFYDTESLSGIHRFSSFGRNAVNGNMALANVNSTNRAQAFCNSDAGTAGSAQISPSYTLDVWNAIAGTFDETLRKVFWNSTTTATNTATITVPTVDRFAIGAAYRNNISQYFEGRLAEIAVWSVALSDAEIDSLYKGFKAYRVRPQELAFYAPLVRDVIDIRNARAITNNNTATVIEHPRVY